MVFRYYYIWISTECVLSIGLSYSVRMRWSIAYRFHCLSARDTGSSGFLPQTATRAYDSFHKMNALIVIGSQSIYEINIFLEEASQAPLLEGTPIPYPLVLSLD